MSIGNAKVGKTCLLGACCDVAFSDRYMTTIGVEFRTKNVEVDGKSYKLQLWDTAGQERFLQLTLVHLRKTHGVIVHYDITNRDSFEDVSFWLRQVDQIAETEPIKMIVGTKADLEETRTVSYDEGKDLADMFSC